MGLGDFRFSLDTAAWQQLRRSSEYRWRSQDRMGREPATQYAGPGQERITLNGTIYPHFKGGLDQVSRMREMAGAGKPMMLTDGEGLVYGDYVIQRIEETQTKPLPGGAPRKMEFRLTLLRYGSDEEGAP